MTRNGARDLGLQWSQYSSRALIDYSNRLHPCSEGPADLVPLDTLTPHSQSPSVDEEHEEDNGNESHVAPGHDTSSSAAVAAGKSADKKATKLCSSLLVRGRQSRPSKKKTPERPPPQTSKSKAQDGELKQPRNGIFVLLGLAD